MRAQWETEKQAISEVKSTKQQIEEVRHQMEEAERNYDLETLAKLKYGTLPELEKKLEAEKKEATEDNGDRLLKEEVTEEEIAEVISGWTGIPVAKLVESEREKLLKLPEILHKRVIGQEDGVKAVFRSHPQSPCRPQGRKPPYRLVYFPGTYRSRKDRAGQGPVRGPVRYGKEHDKDRHVRIHGETFSVERLVGAPPGYVGYDEGGQLTEAVRRKPYSVILFDEIEKAHPNVFNILLQLLDDGRLTDNQGRTVDFKNTIVIMTSNIGSSDLIENMQDDGRIAPEVEQKVTDQLKNYFALSSSTG